MANLMWTDTCCFIMHTYIMIFLLQPTNICLSAEKYVFSDFLVSNENH